ncbi:MAG: ribonuclease HIII [Verrucomicrobiota bacterium]|nr:ribonuclease HIII [Verrucomicrobiota bacterium]
MTAKTAKISCVLWVLLRLFSHFVKPLTSYTCQLTDDQASALETALRARNWKPREVPYARFAFDSDQCTAVLYESGKLVAQGKGTQEFIEFLLEPEILKQARLGYESVLNPDLFLPRLGVDESGKGDFFGPLCIAGAYVNESVVRAWQDSGIRDSKNISSDKKIAELAERIRQTPGCLVDTVTIGNEAYNRLYAKMKSVNTILAWGHARVIENLLARRLLMNPPPARVISDQFASNKTVIEKALMSGGREIELVQRHKAEEDLAVAAASILARDEFVKGLAKVEKQFGMKLPKGASSAVDEAAIKFLAERGAENLSKVAKMHFRTALRAQGLPEPPKTEWKGRR